MVEDILEIDDIFDGKLVYLWCFAFGEKKQLKKKNKPLLNLKAACKTDRSQWLDGQPSDADSGERSQSAQ